LDIKEGIGVMARIDTITYKSWEEFKSTVVPELFGNASFQRGVYIFRGQAFSEWRLEPSFDRCFKMLDKAERSRTHDRLLLLFRKECEGMNVPKDIWNDNLKALALGQHYGLPTRLLDWTESPYVASFFAFSDATSLGMRKGYVAVWALDTRVSIWSAESGVDIIDVPSIGNIRHRNQAGKFTLSKTPFNCLEDYVEFCDENAVALKKFLIPIHDCRKALADLDVMGINHSRVYPELIGCALSAKIRIMLDEGII
jgi:hypothetical protein